MARRPYIAHRNETAAGECGVLEQEVTARSRPFVRRELPLDDGDQPVEHNPRLQVYAGARHVNAVVEEARISRIGSGDVDEVSTMRRRILAEHAVLEIQEAPH